MYYLIGDIVTINAKVGNDAGNIVDGIAITTIKLPILVLFYVDFRFCHRSLCGFTIDIGVITRRTFFFFLQVQIDRK